MIYKIQDDESPEKSCGYCVEASTYNEDIHCWCNKHHKEVSESQGICEDFKDDN